MSEGDDEVIISVWDHDDDDTTMALPMEGGDPISPHGIGLGLLFLD